MRGRWILVTCSLMGCGESDANREDAAVADGGDEQRDGASAGDGDGPSGDGDAITDPDGGPSADDPPPDPVEETTCEGSATQCNGACLETVGQRGSACTLVDAVEDATAIAGSSGRIFYANSSTIRRLDTATGKIAVLDTQRSGVSALAADSDVVYAVEYSKSILRAPAAGGAFEPVISNLQAVLSPTLQDSELWYSGGMAVIRLDPPPNAKVGTIVQTGSLNGYAVDEQYVFAFIRYNGISRYDADDPTQKQVLVATMPSLSGQVFQDDDYLYYTQQAELVRLSKMGGSPEILHEFEGGVNLQSKDGNFLYVRRTEGDHDRFLRVPVGGGEATLVGSLAFNTTIRALAQDGALYALTRSNGGQLLKIALPAP